MIEIYFQNNSSTKMLPHPKQVTSWVSSALQAQYPRAEITVRAVDEAESAELNQTYRHKSGPTNVLSFSHSLHPHMDCDLLGDIIICAPVLEQECITQNKDFLAHWAHLTVHGTLHLMGYDHVIAQDAERMEALETQLLLQLGFPAPYGGDVPQHG